MSKVGKEQIKEWQALWGENLREIVLDANAEGKGGVRCWLKKPDRMTIKYAKSKEVRLSADALDTISPGEILLDKCWLGGDAQIKEDDKYFFRACTEAYKWLNEVTGFLVSS